MFLKLDGIKIIGHHGGTPEDPENYQVVDAEEINLVNKNGNYIYDYNGNYIELSQSDIDNHPVKIAGEEDSLFEQIVFVGSARLVLKSIVDSPQAPQDKKDRALSAAHPPVVANEVVKVIPSRFFPKYK